MDVTLDALTKAWILVLKLVQAGERARDKIVGPIERIFQGDGELLLGRERFIHGHRVGGAVVRKYSQNTVVHRLWRCNGGLLGGFHGVGDGLNGWLNILSERG